MSNPAEMTKPTTTGGSNPTMPELEALLKDGKEKAMSQLKDLKNGYEGQIDEACDKLQKDFDAAVTKRREQLKLRLKGHCEEARDEIENREKQMQDLFKTAQYKEAADKGCLSPEAMEDITTLCDEFPLPDWTHFGDQSKDNQHKMMSKLMSLSDTFINDTDQYGPDLVPGDGFRDRNIVLKAVDTLAVDEEHTLVAFGVVEHIGREGDESITLNFVRRGNLAMRTTVKWKTQNINVADDSYLEQTGSVTFQIGESEQTDTLEIRDNDHWNAEALQWVQLQRDETDNFILGELWRTTVVTLDDDLFPGQVREYYITGQISLPEHVPYEPKQLYQAVSHYFQGEMPGSRKASMRYRLDASDLELTLDPQVPQLVHMKLGVAKHMAEVALKLAHALQAPRTTGDGPGDLDLLYTAELEATKAGTDDTEKAVTLDVKGETSPLNPTKAAAGFIQGSGFPQTADTARLSTVWAMMMFLWDLRGSDAFLAMAIQAYASVNWTVERLFTLVAINFVLHQGGEEGEDGEEGLLQRAAKGVGSGLMQVVKEATAPVLDGSAPGGTEELPPIVVDDEEGFLNRGGGNEWILFLMSGIFVANMFIYQLLKAWYTKLEMGATVRTALRTEAINCMLQLNPEEQERIDAGVALNVITDRIQQISEGWKAFIEFIGQFFLTITMVLMVSYLGSEISGPEKSLGVVFAVLLVVINLLIFMCRFNRSVELDDDCIHHEDEWKHSLLESTSKRGLVTMYRQGRFVATEFEEKLEEHSEAASSFERYNENTEFLLEWLSTIILVFTYLFCGDQVLQGEMKMGTFVVLVETLVKFSTHIASAFEQIQITTSTFSSIVQLSSLLNAQSRRRDLLHSRERSNQLFQEYLEEHGPAAKDKIIVHPDTTVEYTDRDGDHLPVKRPILLPGTQIEQGQIVAVRAPGRNAAGKQTFLKALAQVLCPIKGFVHYPENLHVRLIPAEPQILTGTVLRNLRFGNQAQPPHSDADLQAVCLLFKLSPELYEEQEEGAGIGTRLVGTNGEKLAMTDRVKIAVIRSMLSSVDLLLIDHVLDPLDDQEVTEILDVLKLFVQERGLPCLTHDMKADLKLRKLKTVVIATRSQVIEGLVHNPMLLPSQNSCPGTPTSGTPTSPGTPKSSTKK